MMDSAFSATTTSDEEQWILQVAALRPDATTVINGVPLGQKSRHDGKHGFELHVFQIINSPAPPHVKNDSRKSGTDHVPNSRRLRLLPHLNGPERAGKAVKSALDMHAEFSVTLREARRGNGSCFTLVSTRWEIRCGREFRISNSAIKEELRINTIGRVCPSDFPVCTLPSELSFTRRDW
jgi:hypothetical protein